MHAGEIDDVTPDKLQQWVGRSRQTDDFAAPWPVAALGATLDEDDPDPKMGDAVPPLWHWLYFLEIARQSGIGPDGHAERGEFLPAVPSLPRRMWAGSRLSFDGEPLRIGEAIKRVSTIKSVETKTGSTGQMMFVTVLHAISGARGVSCLEEHDIVYREATRPGEQQRPAKPAPTDAAWKKTLAPDPVLLFRFSALTFNGHRIHYDQPYVTGVEGYPGLIVHGPLMGMLQIELGRRSHPKRTISTFEFRALSPAFANAPITVGARQESDGSLTTWVANDKGGLAQQGKVTFR